MAALLRLTALLITAAVAVAGCSTPRGAALQSEVLKNGNSEETATFQVVHMSRSELPRVAKWPATGWAGGYNWIGKGKGSDSGVLRSGDGVSLVIWDPQENSLLASGSEKSTKIETVVSSDGMIFVPFIGEVQVSGQTPEDARAQIQSALAPVAPSAQVQLGVTAGKRNSVDLVTGVARPGQYPLVDRNSTLLSLIAESGGIDSNLRNPLVRLIRGGNTYEIRSDRLFSDSSYNPILRGGDMVFVEPDRRYFTALGATGKEELVYFSADNITVIEAMSQIGGLSDTRADPKGVMILRSFPSAALRQDGSGPTHSDVIFVFDLTSADGLFAARKFAIQPKDTVYVTESPVVAAQSVFRLVGTVFGLADRLSN